MDINGMKVLSVDDNRNNLMMIEVFVKQMGLDVDSFIRPAQALTSAEAKAYDLVVVDYMMPAIDGIEFIRRFREMDRNTPIVMVTAVGDKQKVQVDALEAGATDFLSKPINYAVFSGRVRNLLKLKKAQILLKERAEYLSYEVQKATREVIAREHETLRVLGRNSEFKDPDTGAHISRVAGYTRAISKAYGVPNQMQEIFYYAAPLHDIGKVGIKDSILLKPDKLTAIEWEIMKSHATIGYEILRNSKSEYLKAGGIIAYTHHERYDGKGYPTGLKGGAIPLAGRIVAVADVFDALTTDRPYKDAWSFDEGLKYLMKERGGHFDPDIIDAFLDCLDEIKAIYMDYQEPEGNNDGEVYKEQVQGC